MTAVTLTATIFLNTCTMFSIHTGKPTKLKLEQVLCKRAPMTDVTLTVSPKPKMHPIPLVVKINALLLFCDARVQTHKIWHPKRALANIWQMLNKWKKKQQITTSYSSMCSMVGAGGMIHRKRAKIMTGFMRWIANVFFCCIRYVFLNKYSKCSFVLLNAFARWWRVMHRNSKRQQIISTLVANPITQVFPQPKETVQLWQLHGARKLVISPKQNKHFFCPRMQPNRT